jgi:hypothetical protein
VADGVGPLGFADDFFSEGTEEGRLLGIRSPV